MCGVPVSEKYRGIKSDGIIYTAGLLNTARIYRYRGISVTVYYRRAYLKADCKNFTKHCDSRGELKIVGHFWIPHITICVTSSAAARTDTVPGGSKKSPSERLD